jgi:hypothetical protein
MKIGIPSGNGDDGGNDRTTSDVTEDRVDARGEPFRLFDWKHAITKPRCDDADGEQRIDEIENQKVRRRPVEKKHADDRHGVTDDDVEKRNWGNEHWEDSERHDALRRTKHCGEPRVLPVSHL